MQTQTIFKAGNSPYVVAIPTNLAKEVNFKQGQKVVIDKLGSDGLSVKRAPLGTKINQKLATAEFEEWLKRFIDENGEALDELAVR